MVIYLAPRSSRLLVGVFAISTLLLKDVVHAGNNLMDPTAANVKEFNAILTDNTKQRDLTCCMGLSLPLAKGDGWVARQYEAMATGDVPGARRVGLSYGVVVKDVDPAVVTQNFDKMCTDNGGTRVALASNGLICPPIFDNYRSDYVNPAPGPAPGPAAPAAAPGTPAGSNKGDETPTGDPNQRTNGDQFVTSGTFNYALTDWGMTRSLTCCSKSTAPIQVPNNYLCAQRKIQHKVFQQQCAKIIMSVNHPQSLQGYTTLSEDGMIVDDQTKGLCNTMWTTSVSYVYGFCRLKFDSAAQDSQTAFEKDCENNGGTVKQPHTGLCLWNVDTASDTDTTA